MRSPGLRGRLSFQLLHAFPGRPYLHPQYLRTTISALNFIILLRDCKLLDFMSSRAQTSLIFDFFSIISFSKFVSLTWSVSKSSNLCKSHFKSTCWTSWFSVCTISSTVFLSAQFSSTFFMSTFESSCYCMSSESALQSTTLNVSCCASRISPWITSLNWSSCFTMSVWHSFRAVYTSVKSTLVSSCPTKLLLVAKSSSVATRWPSSRLTSSSWSNSLFYSFCWSSLP